MTRTLRTSPPALASHPDLPGILLVPLTRGYFAIIDEGDADVVGDRIWSVYLKPGKKYAQTAGKGTTIQLHRFLWEHWGLPPTPEIDHENRDGLDCRRLNLRAATVSQNGFNRGKQRNNTSGYKGVCWHRQKNKWSARIWVAGREIFLGLFDDPAQASCVYEDAAVRLHGEFARTTAKAASR